MENDSTFVAPEGVYSVTDEHKQTQAQSYAMNIGNAVYPSRVSSAIVRFPAPKQGSAPGFAQLLGGGKSEPKKDRAVNSKEREDGVSLSSSDTPDESDPQPPASQELAAGSSTYEPHTLFSHPASAKKKTIARPKHNIRTTSSTFITRIHTVESLSKALQSKQGDVTFLFYNLAKSFAWIEAGSKSKVSSQNSSAIVPSTFHTGATFQNYFLSPPYMP
jgi:catabolite repression protein CreC